MSIQNNIKVIIVTLTAFVLFTVAGPGAVGKSENTINDLGHFQIDSNDFTDNYNYQVNGIIDRNSKSRKTTKKYPVKKGQVFFYTLRTYETSYMVIAFDKDNHLVVESSIVGNKDHFLRSGYYTVPDGVAYLSFSYSTDYNTGDYVEVKEVEPKKSQLKTLKSVFKSTLSIPQNDFVGFPTSFVKNGIIYVIYMRSASHNVVPGRNFFPVYKYSTDCGLTWSEEIMLELPQSDSPGLYRDYIPYVKNVNGKIHAVFNIRVSNSKSSVIRRVAYAKLQVRGAKIKVGELKFFPNSKVDGTLAFCGSDQQAVNKSSSLNCGGEFVVEGNTMYIPIYTPQGTIICGWNMAKPISETSFIKLISIASDSNNEYTEAAITKFGCNWLLTLRNERHKSPLYISRDGLNTVSLLREMPFELNNPYFKRLNNDYAILIARARDCGKHGYLAVLNKEGELEYESFYEDEPLELSDCCSGEIEILNNKIYIFYYASASGEKNGIKQVVIDLDELVCLRRMKFSQ